MNTMKAFYIVENMIAEHENFIEQGREFISQNKGNPKMQSEVKEMKIRVQEENTKLKPLYRIRNAFYGV